MFTPGWKNSKKQLPTVDISVLIYVPGNIEKPFYVAELTEVRGEKLWYAGNSVCSLFFSLEDVTRWILIPLFGGFEYDVEKIEKILPLNSDYRFELIDFEE